MAQVAIDTRDLRNFAKAIRTASRKTGTEFRLALKEGAVVVAVRARELAGSEAIAATVKPGAAGAAAYVQAGNARTPVAVLREAGNTSSAKELLRSERSGKFKHPVFGNRAVWVQQDMHRYLGPAVVEKESEALDKMLEGVNRAFESVHLHWS